jgi:single-stranded-DNA-specific exonuclease
VNLTIVRRAAPLHPPLLDPQMHPVLQRVYAARGVTSALDLALSMQQLLPVGTLDGVAAAALLLAQHRERGGLVLIIGDFDADGATSTALFVRALRSWGFAAVDFLVPNRFEFGYGLTPEIVALAALQRPTLIVTVDNGISSNAGVAAARAAGIDVLVTDHHLPGGELPRANVIVNPNLSGSAFGSRRRGVLRDRGAATGAGCARPAARRCAARSRAAGSGGAGHRGRRSAVRRQ